MYPFITVIVKDLLLLMCIPLISEIGSDLLSKYGKKPVNTGMAMDERPALS